MSQNSPDLSRKKYRKLLADAIVWNYSWIGVYARVIWRTILLGTSIAAFWLSFLLPAYYGEWGYECAWECLRLLVTRYNEAVWLYYAPFNLSNLFMAVVPPLCVFKTSFRIPAWLRIAQVILVLHVISWPIVNIASGEFANVQIGYYVWLASMICVLIAIQRNMISDLKIKRVG